MLSTAKRRWLFVATLAVGLLFAIQGLAFYSLTGSIFPLRHVETLTHPIQVKGWNERGLLLASGRVLPVRGVSNLPKESAALAALTERGVEVVPGGQIYSLVKIHHWCGNDPLRFDIRRVNLSEVLTFLQVGKSETRIKDTWRAPSKPGGSFSKYGWNISEYVRFKHFRDPK